MTLSGSIEDVKGCKFGKKSCERESVGSKATEGKEPKFTTYEPAIHR